MKKGMLFGLAIVALMVGLTVLPAAAVDTTLHDGFKAPVSAAKWDTTGSPDVNTTPPGTLELIGGAAADSITSKMTFTPAAFALAKVKFDTTAGGIFEDNQRFGFNLASLAASGGAGAFFSTVGAGDLKAFVYNNGVEVWSEIVIPLAEADADYHVLKIAWVSANKVEFHVDGVLKADYVVGVDAAITVPGPAKVGLFGNSPQAMVFDWVFVTPQQVNLTFTDLQGILADLDGQDLFTETPIPFPLPTTQTTSFTNQDGILVGSSVHTSSAADQNVAVFMLNEGATITVPGSPDFDFFFTPSNPKFSANVSVPGFTLSGAAVLGRSWVWPLS